MAFDESISECLSLDCTLGVLDACLDVVFIWDFNMLDYWWLILLHCLAYWFWFWHDCSDHFTCIHSPLYITRLDMLILWHVYYFDRLWAWCLHHYLSWLSYSRLSCVYMIDISCSAWLYDAWLPSLCMIACRLPMWVSLLSPYLQLSWFRSFLSSRFSL